MEAPKCTHNHKKTDPSCEKKGGGFPFHLARNIFVRTTFWCLPSQTRKKEVAKEKRRKWKRLQWPRVRHSLRGEGYPNCDSFWYESDCVRLWRNVYRRQPSACRTRPTAWRVTASDFCFPSSTVFDRWAVAQKNKTEKYIKIQTKKKGQQAIVNCFVRDTLPMTLLLKRRLSLLWIDETF